MNTLELQTKSAQYSKENKPSRQNAENNAFLASWIRKGDTMYIALLLLLGLGVLLPGLGSYQILTQGDEEMHIATIRESLSSSSFLFPKFEGVMNLYKPPALFWSGIAADSIFGTSVFAERFPSFLLFLSTALCIYSGLRILGSQPFFAFSFSASFLFTLGTFKFSRLVMMEAFLAFFMAAVSVLVLKYQVSRERRWLVAAGILTGMAFLVKGPLFQVYAGIVLVSFSSVRVFITNSSGKWTGSKRIGKEVQDNVIFHLSALVVPTIWILSLLSYSEAGREFLAFFFLTENLGKFSSATTNQGEWILLAGWLLYSLPFSFLLLFANIYAIAAKAKNYAQVLGKTFVWASLAILMIHLTPNRKDFYYALPILPLAFLGAGAFFSRMNPEILKKPLSYNMGFLIGFGALLTIGKVCYEWILGTAVILDILFAILAISAFIVFILTPKFANNISIYAICNVVVAGILMAYVQFSLIPALSLSDFPESGPVLQAKKVCVIAENPWTALSYKNALVGSDVAHSVPGSERNCIDGDRAVIDYVTHWKPRDDYKLVQSWSIRKRDLTWSEFLENSHGQELIFYYEPINILKNSEAR
ncbi:dolichyl-phosphate-mannose-protein mannosyltransferase [Leptospira broomii serovar Hurstbridge str. 5399]|uniref:Dolichyl-phosphate-mannose-protein mannosyltransferase n=1 Tax=Leptospira broomii serovar Hurstbridge str. 5399 TaxID=1049789 RepID=T0FFE1_9LEPT|nr:phospholipid carrier-dependent glycosyltransferase [Leptospira broomii]EQA46576.1 dolichyl-phosphate-mannose-protein mannosyltransferase [Leptospira broomii serovar Hurstbridge str. 5399]